MFVLLPIVCMASSKSSHSCNKDSLSKPFDKRRHSALRLSPPTVRARVIFSQSSSSTSGIKGRTAERPLVVAMVNLAFLGLMKENRVERYTSFLLEKFRVNSGTHDTSWFSTYLVWYQSESVKKIMVILEQTISSLVVKRDTPTTVRSSVEWRTSTVVGFFH